MANSSWEKLTPEVEEICRKSILKTFYNVPTNNPIENRQICIVLSDDQYMRELNRNYRGKDSPTNVLAFPAVPPACPSVEHILGDIVLSLPTIQKETLQLKKPFFDHLQHLLVHGCLHLLGFTHEKNLDAKKMEETEIFILKQLGIQNPYEYTKATLESDSTGFTK